MADDIPEFRKASLNDIAQRLGMTEDVRAMQTRRALKLPWSYDWLKPIQDRINAKLEIVEPAPDGSPETTKEA